MTLWNVIRDFFVKYVFGGVDSNYAQYRNMWLGNLYQASGTGVGVSTSNAYIISPYSHTNDIGGVWFLSIGDWVSTTATIITLVALVFAMFLLVRWVFRIVVNAFQMR